ncbi:Importin beta-like SAD2 [Bienertia sinuspersici]
MAETHRISQLLNETLNSDGQIVRNATQQLDHLSVSSDFPFSLLSLINGDGNQGQKIAAATYLKNSIRRNVYGEVQPATFSKDFKDRLLESLLRVESSTLRALVEAFSFVVDAEFVKKNSWPELVPQVCYAIQNSDILSGNANSGLLTINALKVLQALLRPFQYFLNPKVAKEPVPPQLEQVATDILVPLLAIFHGFSEKALATKGSLSIDTENVLLLVCKCAYFSVRSYMPASIAPLLPSFCGDMCGILDSLSLEKSVAEGQQVRLKTGKRILLIFCALVTRHRTYSDKLMPDIMRCVLRIARCSINVTMLDSLSERIISLAFDVISHILETGPGWRLVSPHFSSLLDVAIFPALMMNKKDTLEWKEDADEYISKNLPSDLEEVSGWREDLYTARKSAMNLLGVISMSKGPRMVTNSHYSISSLKRKKDEKKKGKGQHCSVGELLVLPFLSKFPVPSDANSSDTFTLNNYYGVLMGYGALQDFLGEQNPEHIATLIRNRVLPLYKVSITHPYLLAAANWILGELSSCLPEDMNSDVYSALLKALMIPDCEDVSCYPVRTSAAGAMVKLLENEYLPPDWLPLLQAIVGRIGNEEEISILLQLLSSVVEAGEKEVAVHIPLVVSQLVDAIAKYMPSNLEPCSQAVIQGFAALAVMAKSWQDMVPEDGQDLVPEKDEQDYPNGKRASDQKIMAGAFSALLQQAWLVTKEIMDDDDTAQQSCIDDASTMLWFIIRSTTCNDSLIKLKVSELLSVWAKLIADWHGWEEFEDLAVFGCIKEVVNLQNNLYLPNFFIAKTPSPPAFSVPDKSLIEYITTFVCEAISQYPSAASRACACVHILLHLPSYSSDTEGVRRSLVVAFSQAAASRFNEIQCNPCPLWKPLLLAVSSCYLYYPDTVQTVLENVEKGGFMVWISALNSISSSSFTPSTSTEREIKLVVIALSKVVEHLLTMGSSTSGLLWECFSSLLAAFARLKEIQEENNEDEENEETENEEDEESDDEEDSDDDVHEETEEEFLQRYAEAAAALEDGALAEEGDIEDFDEEPELGSLEELDPQIILQSLLERYQQALLQKQSLSPELISSLLSFFPEYTRFFQ